MNCNECGKYHCKCPQAKKVKTNLFVVDVNYEVVTEEEYEARLNKIRQHAGYFARLLATKFETREAAEDAAIEQLEGVVAKMDRDIRRLTQLLYEKRNAKQP